MRFPSARVFKVKILSWYRVLACCCRVSGWHSNVSLFLFVSPSIRKNWKRNCECYEIFWCGSWVKIV